MAIKVVRNLLTIYIHSIPYFFMNKDTFCLSAELPAMDFPGLSKDAPKLEIQNIEGAEYYIFKFFEDLEPEALPQGKLVLKRVVRSRRLDGKKLDPKEFFEHVKNDHAFPLGLKFAAWFSDQILASQFPIEWEGIRILLPIHMKIGQIEGEKTTGNDYYFLEGDSLSEKYPREGRQKFSIWRRTYVDDNETKNELGFTPPEFYDTYYVPVLDN